MSPGKFKLFLITIAFASLCTHSQLSMSVGSLSVSREVELNAPSKTVWKMIGDFDEADVWIPIVVDSQLKTGEGVKPGDIRVLILDNGIKLTEKLVIYSDTRKTYTYAITGTKVKPRSELHIPIMDYVATISVTELDAGMSKVQWRSTFNANNVPDEMAIETVANVYDAGMNSLAKHFNQ
jgi:carbon monoxide dehydrogenase subunit G